MLELGMLKAVFFDLDDTLCNTTASRPALTLLAAQRLYRDYPHPDIELVQRQMLEPVGKEI